MKIALIGLEEHIDLKKVLETTLLRGNHAIVPATEADLLLIPHHLDELFPSEKTWIALWITGGLARFQDFREMTNRPRELFVMGGFDSRLQQELLTLVEQVQNGTLPIYTF